MIVTLEYNDDHTPKRITDIVVSTQHDDFADEKAMQEQKLFSLMPIPTINDIHNDIYKEMGDEIIQSLLDEDVELFLDKKIVNNHENIEEATDLHYETEFHDLKLAIKIVDDINEATWK